MVIKRERVVHQASSAITAPLSLLSFACFNLYNIEMFTGREQLRFGQHKDAIAAVVKLQPCERHIRILPIRCTMPFDFTNQNAVIGQIIRRISPDTMAEQAVSATSPSSGSCDIRSADRHILRAST